MQNGYTVHDVSKAKRLISFSPSALGVLKSRAAKLDISVSELLRRIVDEWIKKEAVRR